MPTKKTNDVFDLDAAGEDAEYPPFPFRRGRKKYEIPNLFTLSPAQMDRFDEADGLDAVQEVFREVGAGAVADLLQTLPANKAFTLMKAWRAHSNESMQAAMSIDAAEGEEGKGSASSPSSPTNRAARRSKQTSRSGGSTSGASRSGSRKRN